MRISTATFQNDAVSQMDALEAEMQQTQTELSTGSQMQNAADNPIGMAQVNQMNVRDLGHHAVRHEQQPREYESAARGAGALERHQHHAECDLAGDRGEQFRPHPGEPRGHRHPAPAGSAEPHSIANSTDSAGNYLFGGYANTSPPFTQSGGTVSYNGSDQVIQVQISANQSISGGDTGATAFMNIPTGNGTFTVSAGSANTGTASIGGGTVTDPTTMRQRRPRAPAPTRSLSPTPATTRSPTPTATWWARGRTLTADTHLF